MILNICVFSVCRIDKSGTLIPVDFYSYSLTQDNGYFSSYAKFKQNPDQFGKIVYSGGYTSWSGLKNPYFENHFNCPIYVNGKISGDYPKQMSKEDIWVHPDLEETYKNNGKLEYPSKLRSLYRFLLVSS